MHIQPDPFEEVSKLLVLKRYEKPPPRFFQDFPDSVIARIQAAEAIRSLPWWQRLGLDFDLKPAFVCAFGVILSAGLLIGMVVTHPSQDVVGKTAQVSLVPDPTGTTLAFASPGLSAGNRSEEIPASTAPVAVATPGVTPFSQMAVTVQRVSFTQGN